MASLTGSDKAKCQVVFAVTVTALLLQKACEAAGLAGDKQPAVQQCTMLLSEILDNMDAATRYSVLRVVDKKRISLTRKATKLDILSCLIGAIDCLTGPTFVSSPGTRFDFIRQTLRENIALFLQMSKWSAEHRSNFHKYFKQSVLSVR